MQAPESPDDGGFVPVCLQLWIQSCQAFARVTMVVDKVLIRSTYKTSMPHRACSVRPQQM